MYLGLCVPAKYLRKAVKEQHRESVVSRYASQLG